LETEGYIIPDENTLLGSDLVNLYTRAGFGRVLKAEIDALVFHHLAIGRLAGMDVGLAADRKINYFRINKRHIHALSLELRVTEAVVVRLLENDYLTRFADSENTEESYVPSILMGMIDSTKIKKENIKDGKLKFNVANPIVQKILQAEIFKIGGIVDCSFNKDIVSIELYDILRLLRFSDDDAISRQINDVLSGKVKDADPAGEEKKLLDELLRKPVSEQLKTMLKGGVTVVAKKILGEEGGDDAVGLTVRLINLAKDQLVKNSLPGKPENNR
jgi:hypothetical protein